MKTSHRRPVIINKLIASPNPAVKRIGEDLSKLHESVSSNSIDCTAVADQYNQLTNETLELQANETITSEEYRAVMKSLDRCTETSFSSPAATQSKQESPAFEMHSAQPSQSNTPNQSKAQEFDQRLEELRQLVKENKINHETLIDQSITLVDEIDEALEKGNITSADHFAAMENLNKLRSALTCPP